MALDGEDKQEIRDIIKEELREQLTKLKSEFFDRVDPVLKEVLTAREERPLLKNDLRFRRYSPRWQTFLISFQLSSTLFA